VFSAVATPAELCPHLVTLICIFWLALLFGGQVTAKPWLGVALLQPLNPWLACMG
jgi:hypothetical protein